MISIEQVLATWRDNEKINRFMLEAIPKEGLAAVPLLKDGKPGRGRDVGRMFGHMFDARWSHMRKKEKDAAGKMPEFEKGETPTRAKLLKALAVSGKAVELRLRGAIEAGETIHTKHPLNFLAYLIAHDSHHRGQMLLALKQSGFKLTDDLRWGPWSGWFKEIG
jgi:uncharacterized damage-inducible protein DinB